MIPFSLFMNEYFWSYDQKYYNFLIIFFIFQQLISQIDQNGYNPFCDETLHIYMYFYLFQTDQHGFYGKHSGRMVKKLDVKCFKRRVWDDPLRK